MLTRNGELDCSSTLLQEIGGMCENSDYSDVTLTVEQNKLPGHKSILAARSPYFRARLYTIGDVSTPTERDFNGMMQLNSTTIELNVPLEAFKLVLKFIYTGRLSLKNSKYSDILDLLKLAHDFGIDELASGTSDYLLENLTLENCCAALDAAHWYNLTRLGDATLLYMDRNSSEVLKSRHFKSLTQKSLNSLLERDSFFAPEMDIFKAVLEWRKNDRSNSEFQAIIPFVRFNLIDLEELLTVVRESSTLSSERLLQIVHEKTTINRKLNYRFNLEPDENVASAKHFNAKTIISGIHPLEIVDGNVTNYDGSSGYTYHHINNGSVDNCIIVELKSVYLLNHIKILLWDGDKRSYSYHIEVSVDLKSWERVCDYSKFFCRSWQRVYFKSCPVRYIKLVGTHNTANSDFHVVELEAFYTKNEPDLVNGLTSPTVNVAKIEMGATVIEGLTADGGTADILLNGDVKNYTGSLGFVYHPIGQGSIVIQLAQPYHVGSCRLLLWAQDDRTYSFYVETSVNKKDWTMAVDKRNDRLKSWQELTFEPRPVVFLKITGTFNSSNIHFHVVHFEVPSLAVKDCQIRI